jgi:hypothetical protein
MNKSDMKLSKIYGVETKTRIYIGTYLGNWYTVDNDKYYIFEDVIEKFKPNIFSYFMCISRKIKRYNYMDFASTNIVYDLEEIKENGKTARQTMEKRSLDIILKRLVNEMFEW